MASNKNVNQKQAKKQAKDEREYAQRMRKSTMISIVLLALVVGAVFLIWQKHSVQSQAGEKTVAVQVVHGDKSTKDFTLHTDEEYLGAALENEKLIQGTQGQYGLFVTAVDGEKADESKQQWWCLTKGGATVDTGVDTTPIADGDAYELTLTTGW